MLYSFTIGRNFVEFHPADSEVLHQGTENILSVGTNIERIAYPRQGYWVSPRFNSPVVQYLKSVALYADALPVWVITQREGSDDLFTIRLVSSGLSWGKHDQPRVIFEADRDLDDWVSQTLKANSAVVKPMMGADGSSSRVVRAGSLTVVKYWVASLNMGYKILPAVVAEWVARNTDGYMLQFLADIHWRDQYGGWPWS